MAIHNSPEERQIIKLLEKMPLPEADRKVWISEIQASGMTEELASQIHDRLTAPVDEEHQIHNRAVYVVELSKVVRHWRLALGAKKFR